MTEAISGRSLATAASRSTSDAIVRTSYGVRFLRLAYARSTFAKFCLNALSCSSTSLRTGWPFLSS